MADDTEASVLDPALTVGPDDPLRAWADQNLDWRTGRLLTQDPSKAIQSMIDRGIPPPDVHAPAPDGGGALPFSDPYGNNVDPNSGMPGYAPTTALSSPLSPIGIDKIRSLLPTLSNAPVRTNPDGSIAGNLTAPSNPDAVPLPQPRPGTPATPSSSPLDPEEPSVPLPAARPPEAGPGASDVSAKKKPGAADALGDFSKSLSGIKAPTAPPLNAVGTPSVRSPTAINAPNIANLIALTQGTSPQTVMQALGKLLVAGKA